MLHSTYCTSNNHSFLPIFPGDDQSCVPCYGVLQWWGSGRLSTRYNVDLKAHDLVVNDFIAKSILCQLIQATTFEFCFRA